MAQTNPKPFVFVLMPFRPELDDVYQLGIKAACVSAGAYCERVDEQIFVENILDRLYNQISKADMIVAEMTGRNPNVFYEVGYAHALNKRVILLTQNSDDIPFDLKHYPHIVHGGKITQLKSELEKRIRWCIDNPADSITKVDFDFEFSINGATWQEGLEIEIPYQVELLDKYADLVSALREGVQSTGDLLFSIQIGWHNTTNTVIESQRYHLGLVAPSIFTIRKKSEIDSATLNGQNVVIRLTSFGNVFPDDWNSAQVYFSVKERNLPTSSTELALRLFTELGTKDCKFKANLAQVSTSTST